MSTQYGDAPSLLDEIADLEAPEGDQFHICLPNMAYACGGSILNQPRRRWRMAFKRENVTCPDCLTFTAEQIREAITEMQARQA